MRMDLHTIAGSVCGVLLVIEVGWRNGVLVIVLVGAFVVLAFVLFSNWIVVFGLLAVMATALRLARRHRRRADVGPEQG
jgi:hypothetical protein